MFETIFFFLPNSFELRANLHRFAAVGLIALSAYHLYYCLFTADGRGNLRALKLCRKDLSDLIGTVKYNLGRQDSLPEYPKFNVFEKFEYLGAGWGNVVMIVTGLLLWQQRWTLSFLPLWMYNVIQVVHRYEAILALSVILIWHMYYVHLKPGQFPMGKVFLSGKISLHEMKTHHRSWYKQYARQQLGINDSDRK